MPDYSDGIPNLLPLEGTVNKLYPSTEQTPYAPAWWTYSTITRIPETAVGWLVAQGWQVISTYDEDDVTYYTMARRSMNSWMILQSLLNSYTNAYNQGRLANNTRYNDVVSYWVNAIQRCRLQTDIAGDVSDYWLGISLQNMDDLIVEVKAELDTSKSDMTTAVSTLETQLSLYLSALGGLQPLYDTHETTAEAFLVDLGVAERARINEQFDSTLAKALQQLTDRGMYSSMLPTSVTARVERERSEALTNLADRLAREKLDNEHKLYEQEMALNAMILDGRLKHNAAFMAKAQFAIETRKSLALALMSARMERVKTVFDIRDREEKFMAYQLDTHNNLAIGLWNFVERRDDEYPSMESISKLVAGLGDAGGGWVTP